MSVLEIKNLTHRYDDRYLFYKADLTVNNGEHIGVVGLNGAGKTTFINIVAGNLSHDEGEIIRHGNLKWAYLDQHAVLDGNLTVMEYLLSSFQSLYDLSDRLDKLYQSMGELSGKSLEEAIERAARLQQRLDESDFYDLEASVKKIANGLGVNEIGYNKKISMLSGGERAKLILSKMLLSDPDIMLLDEPTNFLDIEHIDWLMKFLNACKKTFLVISHDEKFLNSVSKFVVNIENGTIKKYTGNYEKFKELRAMNARQYEEDYRRQQSEIKKLTEYIEKNKARAATAGMANARKKQLDKMEILNKPQTIYEAEFSFPYSELNSKDFLIVKDLCVGYDKVLIPPISFNMTSTTKLWIRGTNGVGKTTLLKTLLREIPMLSGSFKFHIAAKILYLKQDFKIDNASMTPTSYYADNYPLSNPKKQRAALSKVGLKGELAIKPMIKLSGGEQVRARLAVLGEKTSNVLILDEPTNHLDVLAKNALKKALIEYPGALILVSHEEDFASSICDKIFDAKSR